MGRHVEGGFLLIRGPEFTVSENRLSQTVVCGWGRTHGPGHRMVKQRFFIQTVHAIPRKPCTPSLPLPL